MMHLYRPIWGDCLAPITIMGIKTARRDSLLVHCSERLAFLFKKWNWSLQGPKILLDHFWLAKVHVVMTLISQFGYRMRLWFLTFSWNSQRQTAIFVTTHHLRAALLSVSWPPSCAYMGTKKCLFSTHSKEIRTRN